MSEFADSLICKIEFPGGEFPGGDLALDMESFDLNTTKAKTMVNTVGRRKLSSGRRRGVKVVEGSFSYAMKIAPQIDWNRVLEEDILFHLYPQWGIGGRRRQLVSCEATDVNEGMTPEGEASWEVSFNALDHRAGR